MLSQTLLESDDDIDYLKYWKVIKYWAKRKYDITTGELELMLFLYSEHLFTATKFQEYNELMSWNNNRK